MPDKVIISAVLTDQNAPQAVASSIVHVDQSANLAECLSETSGT